MEQFSPLERSFLDEESWFESLRILERHPELVSEDFGRRLALASEESGDEAAMHLLRESSLLVARAIDVGVEEAAREKLGEGGVLAGYARETRDRYYETREPRDLEEAVGLFARALACNDDPLLFDHGRTLQGFGATLLDLSNLVGDPIVSHVGCLAFLGATTSHLAVDTPLAQDSWTERLVTLISGVRDHLDLIDSFSPGEAVGEFHRSVRRTCEMVESGLAEAPAGSLGNAWARLAIAMPILGVAYACPRVELPSPPVSPPRDARIEQAAQAWLSAVLARIERFGSDCFRILIASPAPSLFWPEGADAWPSGRRFEPPGLDDLAAGFEPEPALVEAEMTPGREALVVLALAVVAAVPEPDEARARLEQAEGILADLDEPPGRDSDSPFHSPGFLAVLAAGVRAHLDDEDGDVERFRAIREVWPASWIEDTVATVEERLAGVDEAAGSVAIEAAAHVAMCIRDPVARLYAIANDLGLPDAPRYRQVLERLNDLLFGGRPGAGAIRVDEDAPGLAENAERLARFEAEPSALEEDEIEEFCAWLGAAYEAGRVSFVDANAELTMLINLGWLRLNSWHEDTLKWANRARRLALDEGAPMDAATADLNASSYYLQLLRTQPSWSTEAEGAALRLLILVGVLAHALEALRIVTVGLELSDPEDRFHAGALGFGEVRGLIEEALFDARDASLLTEYLLNARGMWFLLDLYDAASGDEPERPVVSWRDRAWVSQSLSVDRELPTNRLGAAAEVDLAEVLGPEGEPQALWFGNMLEGDCEVLASALVASPDGLLGAFDAYPVGLRQPGDTPCLELAAALGRLLPERMWELADVLHERGARLPLFVSLDPALPPISMGLWRSPREGGANVVADAFDVVYCPSLAPRKGLRPWVEGGRAASAQAFVVCDPLGDLPEARIVPELARSVCGNAGGRVGPPADRETVLATLDACALADGVFVYQGHSESGGIDEPGAACLLLEPGGPSGAVAESLPLRELLEGVRDSAAGRMPRRAAFLSCASGSAGTPYDATGLAMGALTAGADAVVSTLEPVADAGSWGSIVNGMVEVLCAPQPWAAFGEWQRRRGRELETVGSEHERRTLASLAIFGAPYVPAAATVGHDG